MRFNIQVALLLAVVMVAVVLAAPPSKGKKEPVKGQQGAKDKSSKGAAAGKSGGKSQAPVKGGKPGQSKPKPEGANGKANGKVKGPAASDAVANADNKKEGPRDKPEGAAMKEQMGSVDAAGPPNSPSEGEDRPSRGGSQARPMEDAAKSPESDFDKGDASAPSFDNIMPVGSEGKGPKERPPMRGMSNPEAGSQESEGKGPKDRTSSIRGLANPDASSNENGPEGKPPPMRGLANPAAENMQGGKPGVDNDGETKAKGKNKKGR